MTRVLLMAADDPDFMRRHGTRRDELIFESARGLLGDTTLGLSSYLSPLLLALSPWVIGVTAARNGGVLIFTFGERFPGQHGTAMELLQLFHPRGRLSTLDVPVVEAREIEAALVWWSRQLAELFTELTDPCNYRFDDESFSIRAQFETLLGTEQAFRNLQSILASDRDLHAARLAALDTLDTLEGLRLGLDFSQMCRLSFAERALARLEELVPPLARPVLLPKARAAVDALRQLQDGFFMSARRSPTTLRLPDKRQNDVEVPLEEAVALWLRLLRNAGRSFRTREGPSRARDDALLLSHNGEVPSELPDLAYLYLLRLVAEPDLAVMPSQVVQPGDG